MKTASMAQNTHKTSVSSVENNKNSMLRKDQIENGTLAISWYSVLSSTEHSPNDSHLGSKSMRIDFNEEDPLLIDQISIGVFRVTPWEYSKCGIFRFLTVEYS